MKKFKAWLKKHKVAKIVLIVLCVALVAGAVLAATGKLGSTVGSVAYKARNEQNIIKNSTAYASIAGIHNGVDFVVNKDGSITLDGKATAAISVELLDIPEFTTASAVLTLKGVDFGTKGKEAAIKVIESDGENECVLAISDKNADVVFTNTMESANIKVVLDIPVNASFDSVTIYPVLNYGAEAINFYSIQDGTILEK